MTGDSRSVWDALDRGEDPTVGDAAEVPAKKAESAYDDSSGMHNGQRARAESTSE